jgi:predicted transcriptional regulator
MARKATNRPTDSELSILRVLWRRGPSTVREVQSELERVAPTGYTTVLKMLQIMNDKSLVERNLSGRAHVYSTREAREEVQGSLALDLVNRVFEGSASQLVLRALAVGQASAEERAEIRQLLDKMEGEV